MVHSLRHPEVRAAVIQDVVTKQLCTQCGSCAALCPAEAIAMPADRHGNRFPRVDDARCTSCGLCLKLCTGLGFPTGGSGEVAGGRGADPDIGPYRSILSAHAVDEGHRFRAATGGVATTLLVGALEAGLAARTLVVPTPEIGWSAEARLATSASEILAASGSWYLPAALEGAMREAHRGERSVAVVGLPCHLQAWRRAAEAFPSLGRKLVLTVGLFCDHLVDARFWRLLARLSDISPGRIAGVRFRGGGWPGDVRFTLDDGSVRTVAYGDRVRKLLWKSYAFTPRRCLLCRDALAESADVSAGDAWLPEFAGDDRGTNALVVRTARGQELVERLVGDGSLAIAPLEASRLVRSQRVQIVMKKRRVGARFALARLAGGAVPETGAEFPPSGASGYALGAAALLAARASNSGWFERLAPRLPWRPLSGILIRGKAA